MHPFDTYCSVNKRYKHRRYYGLLLQSQEIINDDIDLDKLFSMPVREDFTCKAC